MKVGVIITTYNSPKWLEKVFWGYENQLDDDFELIIADDGSGEETKALIAHYQSRNKLNISHVWHEDDGFRKTQILNKAIKTTDCDYLIFTDGDCIPRKDMISIHRKKAKKGRYLSAAYYKLSMPISELISEDDVRSGRAFDCEWLLGNGQPKSHKLLKLTCKKAALFNFLTPARATWNGANSSAFKEDILAVNGFDERMQYGGLDVEMGERMINKGFKGIQMRFSSVCVHLDHKRGYSCPEVWEKNRAIRDIVKEKKLAWTEYGISKP